MKTKEKLLTVLAAFLVLIMLGGTGAWKTDSKAAEATEDSTSPRTNKVAVSVDTLSNKTLVGVAGRMPANSSKIFFESILGRKLKSYKALKNMEECINELKSGHATAIWACDITAKYLLEKDNTLALIDTSDMAAIENTDEPRFEFGMAIKNTKEGEALRDSINEALDNLKTSGIIDNLRKVYIDEAATAERFTEDDMLTSKSSYKKLVKKDTLYIGVTGSIPPLDMFDDNGRPYGFSAALSDSIGQCLQRPVELVRLDNETAFSSLMSGRVDVVFAYGSGMITTEGQKEWLMTKGYCPMQKYEFIVMGR